jgi:diketogulonate reductase-like aldo/keto reductase
VRGAPRRLVAEAIGGRRDEAFLISKVYPLNATVAGGGAPCECSLERLRTDRLNLYLLHWRGTVPLAGAMAAFMGLQAAGKIRHYGTSNLDLAALQELWQAPVGPAIATNQLLYTLAPRGIEQELLRGCASGACRSWPIHSSSRPGSRAIRSSLNSHKLST